MGNLTTATTFIVIANVLMWFTSLAMLSVNPSGSVCFNYENSVIGQTTIVSANGTVIDSSVLADLPTTAGTSSVSTTSVSLFFTDPIQAILQFIKNTPGLRWIYAVVSAPMNLLECGGFDPLFSVGVGVIWYLTTLGVLIAFIFGRD